MSQSTEAQNKATVLEAFDTLFNKRTTSRGRASGHRPTCSTAPTLNPVATVCSI